MSEAKLSMIIPEQLISDTIRAEIIRQMPNKEKFAETVIAAMMSAKKDSYSRETIFQEACAEMVRTEAKAVFSEWLEQNRNAIRDALLKELTRSKAARIKSIVDSIAGGLIALQTEVRLAIVEQ